MHCPRCQRAAGNVFPGGAVQCECGERFVAARVAAPGGGGPAVAFRTAAVRESEPKDAPTISCPYCGNACAGNVSVCPVCEVSFDRARCHRCRTLRPPFEGVCSNCGARDLKLAVGGCPRCNVELDSLRDSPGLRGCLRCGGVFATHHVLAELVAAAEAGRVLHLDLPGDAAVEPAPYACCPVCTELMGRVGFARSSGVIVDVCARHGTWFDRNELFQALRFLAEHPAARTSPNPPKPAPLDAYRAEKSGQLAGREAFEDLRARARLAGTESLLIDILRLALE